jgi:G3E family GTPase
MSRPTPIPIWILTGFLGSGKSTLLRGLLRQKSFERTAILINELGAIGIDDALVQVEDENMLLLSGGCLCCGFGESLVDTLASLYGDRTRRRTEPFERVIIETTGLAEPTLIAQQLIGSSLLRDVYRLNGVVTVVDGEAGSDQMRRHPEWIAQVACADLIVMSKLDRAADAGVLAAEVRSINPLAILHDDWQAAEMQWSTLAQELDANFAERLESRLEGQPVQTAPHSAGVVTVSARIEDSIAWDSYAAWIEKLREFPAERLLRMKGIASMQGSGRPVVLQAVRHVVGRPEPLEGERLRSEGSRIVLIMQDTPREEMEESFALLAPRQQITFERPIQ